MYEADPRSPPRPDLRREDLRREDLRREDLFGVTTDPLTPSLLRRFSALRLVSHIEAALRTNAMRQAEFLRRHAKDLVGAS